MSNLIRQPISAAVLGLLALSAFPSLRETLNIPARAQEMKSKKMPDNPYVGLWVTDDGHVRHALLPNGRYDEARGPRESAYRGRYVVHGNAIDYWDDTGFTADGIFIDLNTLHHGGMVLRRKPSRDINGDTRP